MSHWRSGLLLSQIIETDRESAQGLSPIASIVCGLSKSTLSSGDTPKHKRRNVIGYDSATENERSFEFPDCSSSRSDSTCSKTLFKHAFKIKTTPEGPIRSKPKARRVLGMASRRLSASPETVGESTDKENGGAICSPRNHLVNSQKIIDINTVKSRWPLEDCDFNSQDSGYSACFPDQEAAGNNKLRDGFQFIEPLGVAPRRSSIEYRSPMQSPVRSSPGAYNTKPSNFKSLSSGYESMDDGFNDIIDADTLEITQLPDGICDLLSGHIVSAEKQMECDMSTTPEFSRPARVSFRRSLSLQDGRPARKTISKVRSCLFRSPNSTRSTAKLSYNEHAREELLSPDSPPLRSFKRPDPPTDTSPLLVKRSRKCSSFQEIVEISSPKPALHRSLSETEAHAHIKSAILRSTTDTDLTGDFSKQCVLPLVDGRHQDLKSISTDTLAALIRGEFNDCVNNYKIVDCRYPYEYNGGHIEGALNLYNKDMIEQELLIPLTQTPEIQPDSKKRNILVFHCEFSWERGPNLSRFLRNVDRQRNKEYYPALHYPEIYLLHGGYQLFYKEQSVFCSPQGYKTMKDPDHEADLRQFRSRSKSCLSEKSRLNGLTSRTTLKRLGF